MGKVSPKIFGAIVVGFAMVVTAFLLSLQQASTLSAAETDKPSLNKKSVRTFIPITDNDNNSVPDWQESFDLVEVNLDEMDGQPYQAKSLTGQLAANLGQGLVNLNQSGTTFSASSLASQNAIQLSGQMLDEQFTRQDIFITEDNSATALRAYGNAVADIAIRHAVPGGGENELIILRTAMTSGNREVLEKLEPIIKSYEGMLNDMLITPVPSSLVKEHLSLVNVYQAILNDVRAFRNVYDDALASMLRFRRYPSDASALHLAINNLYLKLHKEGIAWRESDAASKFIKVETE